MRQTFDVRGGPEIGRKNLPLLRETLKSKGLDGFYIPHEDEYQNEYQPEANQRLAWATGFTGSAGAAFVLTDTAFIYVDGRYAIQILEQVDQDLFSIEKFAPPGPFDQISELDLSGQVIGYDPRIMTPHTAQALRTALIKAGAVAKALPKNPIDQSWKGRPRQPMTKLVPQTTEFAGESSADKRARVAEALMKDKIDASVITAPPSIAWLLNIRANDVKCSPLPLGRAILHSDGQVDLYVAPKKVTDEIRAHLGNQVSIHDIADLPKGLAALRGKTVQADPGTASEWVFSTLLRNKATIEEGPDPCTLPKARKNSAEIQGAAQAHIRDGSAIVRFLHWLETGAKPGKTTEIDAVKKLEKFREQTGELQDISFETISGFGGNGAMAHYRVNKASNAVFEDGKLFLVDSGGQYFDGTTDITRTVVIGEPTDEMKRHYTLVLKGHIAMTVIRFPEGTTGTHLDIIARQPLWQAGLDYDHGTGHGVGSYLGVHEGPQRIAKGWNSIPLEPGMIVSNEPGYYIPEQYGIRIENLQYVTEPESLPGGVTPMMTFVPLTLAPYARNLIDTSLLSDAEIEFVDAYHARVLEEVGPLVQDDKTVADWLKSACAPL
ncbi:MAG: X-Pro aminopeptidase [Ponticaulis sp.]|nr:X-Pro aminopeptidase [Ponticaulis sp.]|tara:strand:+ start:5156 stop:6973 length:1818 start_codon:yes stop_codon:yes gene_type:complete